MGDEHRGPVRGKTGYEAESVLQQSLRTVDDWRRGTASGGGAACKADASGASGHVTAKPSICGWDAFCPTGISSGDSNMTYSGQCLCGAIRYQLSGEPKVVAL